jgi:hypothetical protein
MEPAIIIKDEIEVDARLMEVLGVTREECLPVVQAVVDARNDVIDDDPVTAAGQLAYIYGTRTVRRVFRSRGWMKDRADNIESTIHPDGEIKLIYQSTDTACDLFREPKAISEKGPASERAIESGTPFLFPEWEIEARRQREEARQRANATVWLFCVSVDGEKVQAEVSRPRSVEGKDYRFAERIFIVKGGDWDGGSLVDLNDDVIPLDFEPNVTRK